jgi:hypothetical protein
MNLLRAFIAGVNSVLSFGWPLKKPYPISSKYNIIADDWRRISKDINAAIDKYNLEEKNV